jgi:adenosylcobinamide-GDP ribazoletransferase
MKRQLLAATSFLTRLPVATASAFSAEELAKSSAWFPAIGALLGCGYVLVMALLSPLFPPTLVALLIVTAEALLTGALHMDGLADMADGFGGGKTREDVLRIMRDHCVGAYGAVALILLIGVKTVSVATLIERRRAIPFLILAPALGRWSTVFLSNLLPYARQTQQDGAAPGGSVPTFVGRRELGIASAIAVFIAIVVAGWRGIASCCAAALISWGLALLCDRRIGGVTGDTLGASTELCEAGVLLMAVSLS